MSDATRILSQIEEGEPQAAEKLLPLVYDELRKLAAARLAHEMPGQMLQATALVHEAYVQLINGKNGQQWSGRRHFFAAAAEAMRRILIMNARRRMAEKHGGCRERVALDPELPLTADRDDGLLALDEALARLEVQQPEKARLVKLRFFAGMTNAEAALALGISDSTAERHWTYARAWLRREMARAGVA